MEKILYKQEDNRLSRWSGGTTRELCIFPKGSDYLERNFVWRLSTAEIEKEESSFTKLPDYDRTLMVLRGEAVLSYEGRRTVRLGEMEQDSFDGGWKTTSFGKITDFNLMVRKGAEGSLDVIELKPENELYGAQDKARSSHALYCKEGYCVATVGGESVMIRPGEVLALNFEEGEKAEYGLMGEGTLVRARVSYGAAEEYGPEIIPPEKATFDDFKLCVYLSNVQFRLAKYMVKSLKTTWFDEALSAAIEKVERIYLTALVYLAGLVAVGILLAKGEASALACVLALLGWTLADCLLVSPAIYMPFMPKPIRKHIKDVDKLTPYEKEVRERELAKNPRAEKLLKRYKNSGRNLGSDD